MPKSKIFKNHIKILLSEQLRKKKDPTKEAVISQELSLTQKCQKFPKNINFAISKRYEKQIFAIKTAKFNFLGKHNLFSKKRSLHLKTFFIHKQKAPNETSSTLFEQSKFTPFVYLFTLYFSKSSFVFVSFHSRKKYFLSSFIFFLVLVHFQLFSYLEQKKE